jgi:hypothetical protein
VKTQLDSVLDNLSYFKPTDPDILRIMAMFRTHFKKAARMIDRHVVDGRDKAVAFTKLEEACQAAIGALARTRGEIQDE